MEFMVHTSQVPVFVDAKLVEEVWTGIAVQGETPFNLGNFAKRKEKIVTQPAAILKARTGNILRAIWALGPMYDWMNNKTTPDADTAIAQSRTP
mmetsp:Transcript_8216/g.13934  ORF Transcript_8216/g.13934 Transcript_8216/m.13934 type:complete len:94 (+) Transcript_8216:730-1011(+)